ncbi:MAG: SDR family oxidoreductase [Leptolyngbya sp. SIO1E4]|nr:SDR family oxidoreductase [Leptolyngbya sp. SIO1E4]
MNALQGQKIVVIGGSSGIGFAIAKAAAEADALVTISGRSAQKLEDALADIEQDILAYPMDLTQESSIMDFFRREGTVDHLVIAGSSVTSGAFYELPIADAMRSMDSKFWGPYRAIKTAQMQPTGSITLFSGVLSRKPAPGMVAVAAINAAVEGLGRALAVELAPIRVNVISPGLVKTPAYSGIPEAQREAMYQNTAAQLPTGRVGEPEDVAAMALQLMMNPYLTGTVIDIDGGSLLV